MNVIELIIVVLAFALSIALGTHFVSYGWWVMLPAVFFGLIVLAVLLIPPVIYLRRQFSERFQRRSANTHQ
jgi:membrane protein YdbS with pleckstrin-like domain